MELEQLQLWRLGRPGERLLDIGMQCWVSGLSGHDAVSTGCKAGKRQGGVPTVMENPGKS